MVVVVVNDEGCAEGMCVCRGGGLCVYKCMSVCARVCVRVWMCACVDVCVSGTVGKGGPLRVYVCVLVFVLCVDECVGVEVGG